MNHQTDLARLTVRSLLPSLLMAASGMPRSNDKETAALVADFAHDSLEDVARLMGIDRAQGNRDFAELMAGGLTTILQQSFWPAYQQRLNAIAAPCPLDNFNETTVATITPPAFREVSEDAETVFSPLTVMSTTGKLHSYESVMTVSRQVFSTLGAELVSATQQLSRSLYELELQLAAEALQTVSFDADNSTAGALDLTGLDTAIGFLEEQTLTPATLVLAPGKTATVRKLLADSGLVLNIVAMPTLPAGSWYLMPSPVEKPVLGRLILKSDFMKNATAPSVSWTKIDNQRYGYYGARDIGYCALPGPVYRGGV